MTDMQSDPASAGGWHLDKRVPLALIVTLVLFVGGQTVTAIWWASNISSQQADAIKQQTALALRVDHLEAGRDDMSSRLVRVETQIGNVSDQVKDQRDLLLQILQELRTRQTP